MADETTPTTVVPATPHSADTNVSTTPAAATAPTTPVVPPAKAEESDGAIKLTPEQLNERLQRHTAAQLKKQFGIDDPEAIKALLKKAQEADAEAEKQRREKLDETTRLKEDLDKERAARTQKEKEVETLRKARVMDREERRLSNLAAKHIAAEYVDFAITKFAKSLRANLTPKQIAAMTPQQQEAWFIKFAKTNTAFRKGGKAAPVETPPTTTQPVTNGTPGGVAPPPMPPGSAEPMTAKPGQKNTMSKAQVRQKYGYSW